jgi:hypothetical protein
MKRFQIITWELGPSGWVEVADDGTVTYEYDGPDPDGEIGSYLEDLGAGEIEYYKSPEEDPDSDNTLAPVDEKLVEIHTRLKTFDQIVGNKFHDDFQL